MKTFNKLLGLTLAAVVTTPGHASDAIGPGDSDSRWVVGGGAVTFTNIYAGEDTDTTVFPNVAYNGERFFIKDGTVNYSVVQLSPFSIGLTLNGDAGFLVDDDEYEDNTKLAGLKERDATLEGGFYLYHTTDLGRAEFKLVTDLASEHDGQTASVSYTFDLKAGEWSINPTLGAYWISNDKVNHHYGVSAQEVTLTRASYKGGSAFNIYAGVRGRYEFTENWDLNLQAGVSSLDSSIKNSSIVDEDYLYYGSASINYNF